MMRVFLIGMIAMLAVVAGIAGTTITSRADNHGLTIAGFMVSEGTLAHKPHEYRFITSGGNLQLTLRLDAYVTETGPSAQAGDHVAVTYDGTEIVFYVNGTALYSASRTGSIQRNDSEATVPLLTSPVVLGYSLTGSEIEALAGGVEATPTQPGQTATPTAVPTVEPTAPPAPAPFACVEVIGYSQSGQWFEDPGFTLAQFQARKYSGANIDFWADPAYIGWSTELSNPVCDWSEVDTVILTISGAPRTPEAWASRIGDVIALIRVNYPNVYRILLQPVVGGPGEGPCMFDGVPVRAAANHPVIDQGIALAIGGDVQAGASPTLLDCGMYRDDLGHLLPAGAAYIAEGLDWYYRGANYWGNF